MNISLNEELFCCNFTTSIEDTDFMFELLAASDLEVCIKADHETKITQYTTYSNSKIEAEELKKILVSKLSEWKDFGIIATVPSVISIKKEDWTEVWKKYFKIQKITPNVVVKASWLDYDRIGNEHVIEIDPGMSFGTGSHETTQFCLKAIEKISKELTSSGSFLDAGCGSGILSIAACKFGFSPIYAFDYDKESVLMSEENFIRNGVNGLITVTQEDIAAYNPKLQFNIVVANIISGVLLNNVKKLHSLVKHDGYLILAGIMKNEYENVKSSFISDGFKELFNETDRDWTGGIYKKI